MKNPLLLITLLIAAAPAMAGPVGDDGNPLINARLSYNALTPGLLIVMVTFTNLNGYTDADLSAFGGQVYLTNVYGPGTFSPDAAATNGKANSVMAADVAALGGAYAFPTWSMNVTTANKTRAGAAAAENQDVADDYSNPVSLSDIVGEVGFVAYFTYTGLPFGVTINLGGEIAGTDAYLGDQGDGIGPFDVVAPPLYPGPEPATMGLLALGLAGLALRRRKA